MTVFGKIYADAYDALYSDKDYPGECDMIEVLLTEFGAVRPVRRLLDLGCGTGSHAVELAARGYGVTGIDRSPAMIAQARAKAAARGVAGATVFRQGDISETRLDDTLYDGAIMMFAVLSYQQRDEGVRSAIATARTHLVAGAAFVFDVWYGPGVLSDRPGPRRRAVETPTSRIVRCAESRLDETSRLCTVQYRIERWMGDTLAESASEQHVLRFFFPEEFRQLASDCGFVCSAIRDFRHWRLPANEGSWRAIGVFRAV
jgi:SAM-dependent methyltransferase